MDKEFEIIKIECLKKEEIEYKKNIMFCTIFGILNILISILSIKIISNHNILIENDNNENKLLFALAIATASSTLLTFALDGLEINEYRKFKKGNKELLMKK